MHGPSDVAELISKATRDLIQGKIDERRHKALIDGAKSFLIAWQTSDDYARLRARVEELEARHAS